MKQFVILVISILLSFGVSAQEKWVIDSKYLQSKDTVYLFVPDSYDKDKSYPVVFLLHGYSENSKQWMDIIDCNDLANKYDMIIICPDGFVTFYVNSINDNKSHFETFFFKDLVPKVESQYNVDKKNIFISGLSMGGYGALHFLVTYPDFFNTAGSTSGAVTIDNQLTRDLSFKFWGDNRLNDDLKNIFGTDVGDWNKNSITNLLKTKSDFKKPFIFDCGTEDVLYSENLKLKTVTDSLGIPTTFIMQPGNHNANYWNKSIEHHFIFFKQQLHK